MAPSRMTCTVASTAIAWFALTLAAAAQTTAPATATAPATPGASAPATDADSPPAEPTANPPPPPADPIEDAIQRSKTLIPGVWTWGADARLRDEWYINATRLSRQAPNNQEHFQRYRARWWTTINPVQDVEFYTRFTWEGRYYCSPKDPTTSNTRDPFHQPHRGWMDERDGVIIDNLYLKLSHIGGSPFTIQAGRMDLGYGGGWLVYEGTPLDGTRAFYFDAVRVLTDLKDIDTTIDTVYVSVDAQGRGWFPKLKSDEIPALLTEQDEQGAIVYITNKSLPNTSIEPYFIYKHSKHERFLKNTSYSRTRTGDDADIYTFGTRVAGTVDKRWNYSVDVAGQFGHKNDRRLCALGSLNRLGYLLNDKWENEFYVDYQYLSGDRRSTTGTDENFDVLWGRWQYFDEVLGMTFIPETRYFQYANLHRVSPGWKARPLANFEVGLRYDLLFSDTRYLKNTSMFADGRFRGQIIVPYFKYTFNPHMFTRVMPAFFFPGDYYAKSNNDPAFFCRWEVVFTW